MVTMLCMALAGLLIGVAFNAFALLAACLVIAAAGMALAFPFGIATAALWTFAGLGLLQAGFVAGITVTAALQAYRPVSAPNPRR